MKILSYEYNSLFHIFFKKFRNLKFYKNKIQSESILRFENNTRSLYLLNNYERSSIYGFILIFEHF